MHHDGSRSLVRCLCTDDQAREILAAFEKVGARVRTNSPRETEEQRVERQSLFAVMGGDSQAWPTSKCPTCSWFDHHVEGRCGAGRLPWANSVGWGVEIVEAKRREEPFGRDYDACPLDPAAVGQDGEA